MASVGAPPPAEWERPRVVVHVAVSLDGATSGFAPAMGLFYELAATWREDATLTGAETILAQEAALASAPQPGPSADGPLLVVVDSRARVRQWPASWRRRRSGLLRGRTASRNSSPDATAWTCPHCSPPSAVATASPSSGSTAGGALTGALLARGLVDEVSLLIHPVLAGGRRWCGPSPVPATALELTDCTRPAERLVWLRYRRPG